MNPMSANEPQVAPLIRTIRDQRVILDFDLARIYGVETRAFNQAVKRNLDRFPIDFGFQLSISEFAGLNDSTSAQDADYSAINANSSQTVMSSRKHRGARYRPWAFTEHGALMAANILRSKRAIQMSVFIIRAFVKMREEIAANSSILKRLAEIDKTLLVHDLGLRDLYRKLLPLLEPPPDPPKSKIGFHPGNR